MYSISVLNAMLIYSSVKRTKSTVIHAGELIVVHSTISNTSCFLWVCWKTVLVDLFQQKFPYVKVIAILESLLGPVKWQTKPVAGFQKCFPLVNLTLKQDFKSSIYGLSETQQSILSQHRDNVANTTLTVGLTT